MTDNDIQYIRARLDEIANKVSSYGEAITTCKDERETLFVRTNGMRTDITVLKTQKKTKSTIFDIAIRIITILCTIALATMWGIKLASGEGEKVSTSPYCICETTNICVCYKDDDCACVPCRTANN